MSSASTPPNKLLFQTFEWHTKSTPPAPNETHSNTSHYARLTHLVPDLAYLGITSFWLPPGCKANNPNGNGYDCYDLWDLGEFDQKWSRSTKWGSRAELNDLIKVAQSHKLEIIWDAVLNHKTAGDSTVDCWAAECSPEDRRVEICTPKQIQAWLKYEFPGRKEQYSSLKWSAEHFSGTDWDQHCQKNAIYKLIDPPGQVDDRDQQDHKPTTIPKWLRHWWSKQQLTRNDKGWAIDVDDDHGNNDYLMFSNIDYSHEDVVADVRNWGGWMVRDVHVNGFRLDAAQHISYSFIRDWIKQVRSVSGQALFIGEIWTDDVRRILKWLKAVGPDVFAFDSPLLYNFSRCSAALEKQDCVDLRQITNGSLLQNKPKSAVTLVTNHDTQPGQTSHTTMLAEHKLLFYAYILLRQDGLPCVFWGDLFGTSGPDPEAPIGVRGSRSLLCDLLLLRHHVAYGKQEVLGNPPWCWVWRRRGTHDRPGCIVLVNVGRCRQSEELKLDQSNDVWIEVLQRGTDPSNVTTSAKATAWFECEPLKVAVFVRQEDLQALKLPFPWLSMRAKLKE